MFSANDAHTALKTSSINSIVNSITEEVKKHVEREITRHVSDQSCYKIVYDIYVNILQKHRITLSEILTILHAQGYCTEYELSSNDQYWMLKISW